MTFSLPRLGRWLGAGIDAGDAELGVLIIHLTERRRYVTEAASFVYQKYKPQMNSDLLHGEEEVAGG